MANEFFSNRLAFILSVVTGVVLISLLGLGCSSKNSCGGVEDKFRIDEKANEVTHIYVDISGSMSGFLSDINSNYLSFVKRILPNNIAGFKYRLFGFGNRVYPL